MNSDKASPFPISLPQTGNGEEDTYATLANYVKQKSTNLGAKDVLAHMDPAPADIAAKLVGLNAQYNQNLLHPDLSPFATQAEKIVIDWLLPFFGMACGHMCAGSTLTNLTALWAARENGSKRVITSSDAHISVAKSAAILGMPLEKVPVDSHGKLNIKALPDVKDAVVVLNAGTTGRGVIDNLHSFDETSSSKPHWLHIDAAWGGPLCLTRYKDRLNGIENADSISISAHKWLFQPKDSAIVLFADEDAHDAVSYGGSYLATPNVGVQGSRSAAGVALLGTLMAWGSNGLDEKIHQCISISEELAQRLDDDPRTELRQFPETGVVNWRPISNSPSMQNELTERLIQKLGTTASRTVIDGDVWVRQVAANMYADIAAIWRVIDEKLQNL